MFIRKMLDDRFETDGFGPSLQPVRIESQPVGLAGNAAENGHSRALARRLRRRNRVVRGGGHYGGWSLRAW